MAKRIGACADDERLHYLLHQLRELEKPTWRYRDQLWGPFACVAPPNRGGLNSTHIHGTSVPVEEPSTASKPDSCTAPNDAHVGLGLERPGWPRPHALARPLRPESDRRQSKYDPTLRAGSRAQPPLSRSRPGPGPGRGRWLPPRPWEYVTRGPHK